ncbi:DUF5060 domain-containing protein [Erythrobacter insulae]|nr:DUF5060 domain-containing protein [Erythrobacter insulae]
MAFEFTGPDTSEFAAANPFTDYRLVVAFYAPGSDVPTRIRGFYAADGDAADTSAVSGGVWRAMFTPDREGRWRWTARLAEGSDIAIDQDVASGTTIAISQSSGSFDVGPSLADGKDWRASANGRLVAKNGELIATGSGNVWLKTGANSPENLLGYSGFDGTWRIDSNARDGESDSGKQLHRFEPHQQDWRPGDPEWGDKRGHSMIGAVNYLADNGINAAYFLVWNVEGDGKDVWPFIDPNDQTRFDTSKLDQWERVFTHMQNQGIALHVVLQETENELLMDGGDTGRIRKLFIAELVARFGHHNALIWNLGEENGPVHWRPEGQNDAQRRAMIEWLTQVDPYNHPILLHTHAEPDDKDAIAGPLLGLRDLDGLSLQIADPALVHAETVKWFKRSSDAGHRWVLTMDEIGPWQNGAIPDVDAKDDHLALIREALWGHILAGGSGVEWYFGAKFDHNDLSAEDFRSREKLWASSHSARQFIEQTIELGSREICPSDFASTPCLRGTVPGTKRQVAIVYLRAGEALEPGLAKQRKAIEFRDPLNAAELLVDHQLRDRIVVIY